MVLDLTLLLVFQLAGEAVAFWSGLPVPGPVVGLVLLAAACGAAGRVPATLASTAPGLLRHLSLLFVPAGVGVMLHVGRLADELLAILASLVLSTWLTVAVTALVFRWAARRLEAAKP